MCYQTLVSSWNGLLHTSVIESDSQPEGVTRTVHRSDLKSEGTAVPVWEWPNGSRDKWAVSCPNPACAEPFSAHTELSSAVAHLKGYGLDVPTEDMNKAERHLLCLIGYKGTTCLLSTFVTYLLTLS